MSSLRRLLNAQPRKCHELKILPEYFAAVKAGRKTAELRIDDRDFLIGDCLVLKEWRPRKKVFTGRVISRRVTDITRLSHWVPVSDDWVVLHMGAAA